jgi:hypothetical protein
MFIGFKDAEIWYNSALDGLRHLQTTIHSNKKTVISDKTLNDILGMRKDQWLEYLDARESEHEMFASLALLSCFEGIIRRDAEARGRSDKAEHYQKFRNIKKQNHISIIKIFETWESSFGNDPVLSKQFNTLRSMYISRNILAHGKATRHQFAFHFIHGKLDEAKRKIQEKIKDFDNIR